jgi:hypothetical protein
MASRLGKIKDDDWRMYRRVARYYERELKRIYQATALPAAALRRLAKEAVYGKAKSD